MLWVNILHLYQPANADDFTIRQAVENSYVRIVRALEENPRTKFTVNISGCLLVRIKEIGYGDLIERIKKLWQREQIELIGTAAYHPLLPLIPFAETISQIHEDKKIKQDLFGSKYKPSGFFLPELAYSPEVARIVKSNGFDWIALDEICHSGNLGKVRTDNIYTDDNSQLIVLFRDRKISNGFPPDKLKLLDLSRNTVIITATDAELYGLRHIDQTAEFEKILKQPGLKTELASKYITANVKNLKKIKAINGTWSSLPQEIRNKNFYSLWNDKKNNIHQKLWRLTDVAYKLVEKNKDDKHYSSARWHLVRGMASCTYWWASNKTAGDFSPIAWNPDQVELGVNDLVRSIRSLSKHLAREKIQAEKIASEIKLLAWTKHWKKL